MGKILGIKIQNYGSLKDIQMGRLFTDQSGKDLDNMQRVSAFHRTSVEKKRVL